jgi:beta-glucosidase
LFPFGFGLSYTTFRYDHLAVDPPAPGSSGEILVSVDVTNQGDRQGEEVAQVYVRQDVGSVETPDRSLKGFSRISLNRGETRNVIFHIPQDQLAVWNAESEWKVEAGSYTLWVGGSSQASLTTKFVLGR